MVPRTFQLTKDQRLVESFEKICNAQGLQNSSTKTETEAALVERTKRSVKIILNRYMEENGYKSIHKLLHFVPTLKFRKNFSIDLRRKDVENSYFSSILHSKPLREYKKTKHIIGIRVGISMFVLPFRKGYKTHFTKEVFGNCCNYHKKTTYMHSKS